MNKSLLNWSGGKDSANALYKTLNEGKYSIRCLLTSVSEEHERISMHGVRTAMLDKQIQCIGIPLHKVLIPETASLEIYDNTMHERLVRFREENFSHVIFGDVFLEDLREYKENQMKKVGLQSVFPLWKINSLKVVQDFIDAGFRAVVTCVDERYLDKSFLGRIIDNEFLNDLPENVDPCGENGEYHSFVFDGPIFSEPLLFSKGEIVYKKHKSHSIDDIHKHTENGFYFCDIIEN